MNREELAWAAGFFDGEGCTTFTVNSGLPTKYPRLSVSQKHEEVLLKFQLAVGGLGTIVVNRTRGGWIWRCTKFEHVQAVIAMLWPWLGPVKKAQAKRRLDGYAEKEQE